MLHLYFLMRLDIYEFNLQVFVVNRLLVKDIVAIRVDSEKFYFFNLR